MAPETDAALQRLDVLIGRWKTEGSTTGASAVPADRIDAVDTYERLPGGALLHLVDAKVGDQKVEGAEIIGYDPARAVYLTQYFGSDGPNTYEASLVEEEGALRGRCAPGRTDSRAPSTTNATSSRATGKRSTTTPPGSPG